MRGAVLPDSVSASARLVCPLPAFEAESGVPIVLNTSFNENEPIVNTPAEALDCFLRTKMDRLVMGEVVVARSTSGSAPSER